MHAVLTGDVDLAREAPTEFVSYFTDQVDGSRAEPLPGTTSVVACWGDTDTVRGEPARAAVSADGTRASPAAEGHHWGTVCPTDDAYRERLLERIETVGRNGAVRLTTVGFPGSEFCRCDRCDERFGSSPVESRDEWRASVVTDFVVAAADRVAGEFSVTLYPDPYPGASRERAGLDPSVLETHVDGVVVPLCGNYETPYWVETLARGFGRELGELDLAVSIQLSVDGSGVERLRDVTRMVEPHCDRVVYGTFPDGAENVERVLNRRRANEAASASEPRKSLR